MSLGEKWTILLFFTFYLYGCIENPGPDRELGQEQNGRVTQDYETLSNDYNSGLIYGITARVTRRNGQEFLSLENVGYTDISDADILIRLTRKYYHFYRPWVLVKPSLDQLIHIRSLSRNQTIQLGVLDSVWTKVGKSWDVSARFLSISNADTLLGCKLGGFYTGNFLIKSKDEILQKGNIQGLIAMNGSFHFFPDSIVPEKNFYFEGQISALKIWRSKMNRGFPNQSPIPLDTAIFQTTGDSLQFIALQTRNKDTVKISVKKYTPTNSLFWDGR